MRITCPNCGAQYEVPNEVIPTEGRDVQCSNCGDTWFQAHPDHMTQPEPEPAPPPAAAPKPEPAPKPAPTEKPKRAPEPEQAPDTTPVAARPVTEAPQKPRKIDPEVAGILRDEAEHEAKLRSREGASLESQGDLGLDSLPGDEAGRLSREARERKAKTKGEPAAPSPEPAAAPAIVEPVPHDRPRSRLLPDVEEINSTLNAGGDSTTQPQAAVSFPVTPEPKRGGFARGFGLVVLLAIILAIVYIKADAISVAVPALAPVMEGFTSTVDSARLWLDTKLSAYIPR